MAPCQLSELDLLTLLAARLVLPMVANRRACIDITIAYSARGTAHQLISRMPACPPSIVLHIPLYGVRAADLMKAVPTERRGSADRQTTRAAKAPRQRSLQHNRRRTNEWGGVGTGEGGPLSKACVPRRAAPQRLVRLTDSAFCADASTDGTRLGDGAAAGAAALRVLMAQQGKKGAQRYCRLRV